MVDDVKVRALRVRDAAGDKFLRTWGWSLGVPCLARGCVNFMSIT